MPPKRKSSDKAAEVKSKKLKEEGTSSGEEETSVSTNAEDSEKKWNLKIGSWNVNGIRAWLTKNGFDYMKKENLDIFCLQETKCSDGKIPDECKIDGYFDYWNSAETEGYSGCALYSKTKPLSTHFLSLSLSLSHPLQNTVSLCVQDIFSFSLSLCKTHSLSLSLSLCKTHSLSLCKTHSLSLCKTHSLSLSLSLCKTHSLSLFSKTPFLSLSLSKTPSLSLSPKHPLSLSFQNTLSLSSKPFSSLSLQNFSLSLSVQDTFSLSLKNNFSVSLSMQDTLFLSLQNLFSLYLYLSLSPSPKHFFNSLYKTPSLSLCARHHLSLSLCKTPSLSLSVQNTFFFSLLFFFLSLSKHLFLSFSFSLQNTFFSLSLSFSLQNTFFSLSLSFSLQNTFFSLSLSLQNTFFFSLSLQNTFFFFFLSLQNTFFFFLSLQNTFFSLSLSKHLFSLSPKHLFFSLSLSKTPFFSLSLSKTPFFLSLSPKHLFFSLSLSLSKTPFFSLSLSPKHLFFFSLSLQNTFFFLSLSLQNTFFSLSLSLSKTPFFLSLSLSLSKTPFFLSLSLSFSLQNTFFSLPLSFFLSKTFFSLSIQSIFLYISLCLSLSVSPQNYFVEQTPKCIEKHDKEGRVITAEYDSFHLVTAYIPNAGKKLVRLDYRSKEWDVDFLEYLKKLDAKKPVILCGDLNVAHKEIDLKNPKTNKKNAGFTIEEREGFTKILDSGFVDSLLAKDVGWRLDYFVISEKLTSKLSFADEYVRHSMLYRGLQSSLPARHQNQGIYTI
ncbi:APEX1 [Acanthosepion pharaonis]|uniref:DNA-(apurinic or apyrimidinic site) endonuclease n=1 Tax=Acanthosepion pharaonis TaxID=158019 RepID=A0A812B7V8_ACAPH|nr:APEX1 [Sepia pharaonis]